MASDPSSPVVSQERIQEIREEYAAGWFSMEAVGDLLLALDVALARAAAAEQRVSAITIKHGELMDEREAELSRLRAERTWQPIETAPEAERVWVWVPNAGALSALKTTHPSDGAVWWTGQERVYGPTRWQPPPSPPGASQE